MHPLYSEEMMEKYLDISENFALKWFIAFDDPFLSDPNFWDLFRNLWRHRNRYVGKTEVVQAFMPRVDNRKGIKLMDAAWRKGLIEIGIVAEESGEFKPMNPDEDEARKGDSKRRFVRLTADSKTRFEQGITNLMRERKTFFDTLPSLTETTPATPEPLPSGT